MYAAEEEHEYTPNRPNTLSAERRGQDRLAFSLEVSGEAGHQFFTGFSENVSSGGLFIATYQTLPIGSHLRVAFRIPGVERSFDAETEVRWVREPDDRMGTIPGMGVRFLNLSEADTVLLDHVLRRLETLFYDG